MSGIRRYPYSLRLAQQAAHHKQDRFYGSQVNLRNSRKKALGKTNVRWLVQRLLKKLGAL